MVINLRVRPRPLARGYKRGNRATCKYRLYPTPNLVKLLIQTFGCMRFVYNSILRWRTDAWYVRQGKISYTQATARIKPLKKEPESAWLNDICGVSLQQALHHLQMAFSNVFAGHADIRLSKANSINRPSGAEGKSLPEVQPSQ